MAARALRDAGMSVIARNYRWRQGEIDIIALDGETVVFAEVKTWSKLGIENLGISLNERKRRKIIETAKYFLQEHRQYENKAIRFDVVFIAEGALTHLASAFMETV
ncbi:MAG: YraN family protein [Treponema sp.]|nr:YraN family protein [Treponema sp.]